jgi:hypothetical protein
MGNKNSWDSFFLNDSNVGEDFFVSQSASSEGEITIKVTVDPNNPKIFPKGFVNKEALDATAEVEIELHKREDDEQARLDALNKNA